MNFDIYCNFKNFENTNQDKDVSQNDFITHHNPQIVSPTTAVTYFLSRCRLTSSGKYFMHIWDENRLSNNNKIIGFMIFHLFWQRRLSGKIC